MNVNVNTWKWCSVSSGTELLKRIFLYAQWWNFWLHAAYTDNTHTLLYIRYTGYSTWLVNCIIVPWLLLFSLCRMKPWWGPCSCLRTWCRTKRRWRRQRHGGKKWEGLVWVRVCECGWMHMCNTSDLSSSSRSVSSLWFWVERPPPPPPTVTWTKGFGLEMLYTLSLSCRGFSAWTQSDRCDRLGHITLGPVSKIWPVND